MTKLLQKKSKKGYVVAKVLSTYKRPIKVISHYVCTYYQIIGSLPKEDR